MNRFLKIWQKTILLFLLVSSFSIKDIALAHAPHDEISILEISPNYNLDKTLFVVVRNNLLKSQDGGSSWKRIIQGLDNRANFSSLVFSQRNNSLFLSSRGDGIYKSQDNGSSWIKVNNGLANLSIGLLFPLNNQVVFAAGNNNSLYKTTNGGKSWYQVINNTSRITAIISFPNSTEILAGDSQGNLYISTDSGEIWSQRFQFLNSGGITAIAISPNFSVDGTFFIGTANIGVFKTVNRGTSFLAVNNGILDQQVKSLVLSPNYRTDGTIFASTWHQAVFKSNNRGTTWQKSSQGITTDPQANEINVPNFRELKISTTFVSDQTIFLAGFDGLFKSINGGLVWNQLNTLPTSLITGLALSPNYQTDRSVAVTTYIGGAYKTIDAGITWTNINRLLRFERLGDIVFSPNYRLDNTIFSYGYNTLLKSIDGGSNWRRINCGATVTQLIPSRLEISPNFALDQTLYFGSRIGKIFRSTDSGENCSVIFSAMGKYIRSLAISPNFSADATLYAGVDAQGVYRTLNGGNTWQPASNGLTSKSGLELAISPNYQIDKTVFVGTTKGLFKTINGGQNWVKLSGSTYGADSYIETVAISPNYQGDRTVVIHVKGKGLFKTTNGGVTFTQIASNLVINNHPLANMYTFESVGVPIKFSSSYRVDRTIYASSGEELFQSTNGGNTWHIMTIPMRENTTSSSTVKLGYH